MKYFSPEVRPPDRRSWNMSPMFTGSLLPPVRIFKLIQIVGSTLWFEIVWEVGLCWRKLTWFRVFTANFPYWPTRVLMMHWRVSSISVIWISWDTSCMLGLVSLSCFVMPSITGKDRVSSISMVIDDKQMGKVVVGLRDWREAKEFGRLVPEGLLGIFHARTWSWNWDLATGCDSIRLVTTLDVHCRMLNHNGTAHFAFYDLQMTLQCRFDVIFKLALNMADFGLCKTEGLGENMVSGRVPRWPVNQR